MHHLVKFYFKDIEIFFRASKDRESATYPFAPFEKLVL